MDSWTDFIYFGNVDTEFAISAPVIVSPPENHGGKYGYALLADGSVEKLPADLVRALVARPWMLATNDEPSLVKAYRDRVVVTVPHRLKVLYGN